MLEGRSCCLRRRLRWHPRQQSLPVGMARITMNDGAAASCSASCRTTPMKAVPSRAQAATMVEEMVVTLTLSLTVMAMANAMATGTKIN